MCIRDRARAIRANGNGLAGRRLSLRACEHSAGFDHPTRGGSTGVDDAARSRGVRAQHFFDLRQRQNLARRHRAIDVSVRIAVHGG